jgi:hypothetical protein
MKRFVTRALIVVAAILGIVFAQVAPASATTTKKLESNLAALWTTVLETSAPQFPVLGPCWDLGHNTVAPFFGGTDFSCTIKPGTKLFVVGFSTECSTFDADCDGDPDFGDCDATPDNLLDCARLRDSNKKPKVTLDGTDVPLTEVETPALKIDLPEDNVFDTPASDTPGGPGLSVAHGFVALLHPLTQGTHTIMITGNFPTNTTTIVVTPGH